LFSHRPTLRLVSYYREVPPPEPASPL
jgi:hypothetical protein